MGIRLLAFSQRTLHVDSFGKPADAGGVSRYLRAVGKWSGRRAGGIQCDLDGYIGERRGELLSVCSPVRSSAGLSPDSAVKTYDIEEAEKKDSGSEFLG